MGSCDPGTAPEGSGIHAQLQYSQSMKIIINNDERSINLTCACRQATCCNRVIHSSVYHRSSYIHCHFIFAIFVVIDLM